MSDEIHWHAHIFQSSQLMELMAAMDEEIRRAFMLAPRMLRPPHEWGPRLVVDNTKREPRR